MNRSVLLFSYFFREVKTEQIVEGVMVRIVSLNGDLFWGSINNMVVPGEGSPSLLLWHHKVAVAKHGVSGAVSDARRNARQVRYKKRIIECLTDVCLMHGNSRRW